MVAFAVLQSTEKRLLKNEIHASEYCNQMKEMLDDKVARRLSKKEMELYNGPVHYISHHEVIKRDSISTPCRIVFNASANYKGHILNEYWAKGPDLIVNLLGLLLRFREKKVGLVGDIKRMYHTVKMAVHDQHVHRFLWRNLQLHKS